jgi:hypothetical protein
MATAIFANNAMMSQQASIFADTFGGLSAHVSFID